MPQSWGDGHSSEDHDRVRDSNLLKVRIERIEWWSLHNTVKIYRGELRLWDIKAV